MLFHAQKKISELVVKCSEKVRALKLTFVPNDRFQDPSDYSSERPPSRLVDGEVTQDATGAQQDGQRAGLNGRHGMKDCKKFRELTSRTGILHLLQSRLKPHSPKGGALEFVHVTSCQCIKTTIIEEKLTTYYCRLLQLL